MVIFRDAFNLELSIDCLHLVGLRIGTSSLVWLVSTVTPAFFGTTWTGLTHGLSDIANPHIEQLQNFFFHHFHHEGIEPPLALPYRFGILLKPYSVHIDGRDDPLNVGDGSPYRLLMLSKNPD